MQKKFVKMLEEMDSFLDMLKIDEQFKDMEDNLLWLINHESVPDEKKVEYVSRIHEID